MPGSTIESSPRLVPDVPLAKHVSAGGPPRGDQKRQATDPLRCKDHALQSGAPLLAESFYRFLCDPWLGSWFPTFGTTPPLRGRLEHGKTTSACGI